MSTQEEAGGRNPRQADWKNCQLTILWKFLWKCFVEILVKDFSKEKTENNDNIWIFSVILDILITLIHNKEEWFETHSAK